MIKRRIFLVDDDADLRKTLVDQLTHYREFELLEAGSATEALAKVREAHVDLMILDVGLPDMDGREAVKILRREGFKSPILMLTGHDTDSDEILGLESGANDYVTKPFRFSVLLARIRAALRQHDQSEDVVFTIGPYSFQPAAKLLEGGGWRQDPADRQGNLDPQISLPAGAEDHHPRRAAEGSMGV